MGGKASSPTLSSRVIRSLEAIGQVLARHPQQGMLIGGMAIIARGFDRTTRDIDVTFSGADLPIDFVKPSAYGVLTGLFKRRKHIVLRVDR